MGIFLGIDTSNYTTSMALLDWESGKIMQQKKLLPVEKGKLGLRQSEALFQHVRQLPDLASLLFDTRTPLSGIGVSTQPRRQEGSYMPCFLAGESQARTLGAALQIPVSGRSCCSSTLRLRAFGLVRSAIFGVPFFRRYF